MTDDKEYPSVKFLRLKTGDDIISEMVELGEDDITSYHLINPFKVVYMPTGKPGYVQIAFMPWVFTRINEKQEFTINSSDVLLVSEISEKMSEYYWDTLEGLQEPETDSEKELDESELDTLREALEQLSVGKRTLH